MKLGPGTHMSTYHDDHYRICNRMCDLPSTPQPLTTHKIDTRLAISAKGLQEASDRMINLFSNCVGVSPLKFTNL